MIKVYNNFLESLISELPKLNIKGSIVLDELTLIVPSNNIYPLMLYLRDRTNCRYKIICDITATDFLERELRFEVVYNLISVTQNSRIRVKTSVNELTELESLTSLFPSANWYEREVWDFYGIIFKSHPNIRRILTDYGFNGHPLRKDFPLTGYSEVRFDVERKGVVNEPIELAQEYRTFNFSSPWDNTDKPLLNSEKKI